MTKQGMKVAKAHGEKLPAYGSLFEAEQELLAKRDRLLSGLLKAAHTFSTIRLDYSPESLKDLEHWYFELLKDQKFQAIGLGREILEESISMYLGEVFVAHRPAFKWVVNEYVFKAGCYEIGISNGPFALMLSSHNLEIEPGNIRQQSLWRFFKKYSM